MVVFHSISFTYFGVFTIGRRTVAQKKIDQRVFFSHVLDDELAGDFAVDLVGDFFSVFSVVDYFRFFFYVIVHEFFGKSFAHYFVHSVGSGT